MAELLLRDYDAEVLKEPGALDIEHFAENYVGLEWIIRTYRIIGLYWA